MKPADNVTVGGKGLACGLWHICNIRENINHIL